MTAKEQNLSNLKPANSGQDHGNMLPEESNEVEQQ